MGITRRECLAGLGVLAAAAPAWRVHAATSKLLRGAFMILNTPFTSTGDVDWEDLARELVFVDRCGCHGVVWPQGSSGVATLTLDERLRGMEVLAEAGRGRRVALVLGVQGRDVAEMLDYAQRAERLEPDAMIAMPPSSATSMDDYRTYFRALARVTTRPVIVQTSGGAKDLPPTTDLIIELARDYPNFGYVKEESEPLTDRIRVEVRNRPPMKGIFGANLGVTLLYQLRLGVDGVITGNAMYGDLMARMWDFHVRGQQEELRDAFARFLLMRNLNDQIRGADLYIMKKRGVFKTMVTRAGQPAPGARPRVIERTLTAEETAEVEYRFEALRPYLLPGL